MTAPTPDNRPFEERYNETNRRTTDKYRATEGINRAVVTAIQNLIETLGADRDVAIELVREQLALLGNNNYFLDNLYSTFEIHPQSFEPASEEPKDSES